jgi:hypothetical protein
MRYIQGNQQEARASDSSGEPAIVVRQMCDEPAARFHQCLAGVHLGPFSLGLAVHFMTYMAGSTSYMACGSNEPSGHFDDPKGTWRVVVFTWRHRFSKSPDGTVSEATLLYYHVNDFSGFAGSKGYQNPCQSSVRVGGRA